jgi:hypothetical protein
MKKHKQIGTGVIISTFALLAIFCGVLGCRSKKVSSELIEDYVQIKITSEFNGELNWGAIDEILEPFAMLGLCNVEINEFLFKLPSTHWNGEGRDDDPLFLQNNDSEYDRYKLVQWSTKHPNDEVQVFFGEMISFEIVKDVITTLQEHDIEVRFRHHKEANSIQVSLYGLNPEFMLNQNMEPMLKTPVD